jgi:hypothetical protein
VNLENSLKANPVSAQVKYWRQRHERLMREDPQYRAQYEKLSRVWDDVFGPAAEEAAKRGK